MALSSVLSSSLSSSSSTCRFCDGKDDVLLSTKVVFSLFSSFFSPLAVSAAAAEEEEEGRGGGGQEDETDALVKLTPPLLMSSIVNEEGLALECWQLFSLFLLSLSLSSLSLSFSFSFSFWAIKNWKLKINKKKLVGRGSVGRHAHVGGD